MCQIVSRKSYIMFAMRQGKLHIILWKHGLRSKVIWTENLITNRASNSHALQWEKNAALVSFYITHNSAGLTFV